MQGHSPEWPFFIAKDSGNATRGRGVDIGRRLTPELRKAISASAAARSAEFRQE
jgi:hypothetical protein